MPEEVDHTLLTALQVFFRYGYRKTSLDDIAQAAGVSRQTLYQRYTNKEKLFVAAVEVKLKKSLMDCAEIADADTHNVETQLLKMFDVWCGPYLDLLELSPHASEIMSVSNELVGDCCEENQAKILVLVDAVLKKHNVPRIKDKSVTSQNIAETLGYLGKGIFHQCDNRKDFNAKMTMALSVICKI